MLKNIVLSIAAVVLLAGCATMDGMGQDFRKVTGPGEAKNRPDADAGTRAAGAPALFTDPARDLAAGGSMSSDRLMEIANRPEESSVEVFSLDKPLPDGVTALRPEVPGLQGQPYAKDPNVTVYPVDGGNAMAGQGFPGPYAAPGLLPPVSAQPPLPAPFYEKPELLPPPVSEAQADTRDSLPVKHDGTPEKLYFKHDSSALSAGDKSKVDDVASAAASGQVPVLVEGHASVRARPNDPVERKIVNLKKSMDRAFTVSSTLIRKGVPVESITTVAYGDGRPVLTDPGRDIEAANRRVDVYTGDPK